MTETRPPQGIDPRFDPRFQRGYDGEADATAPLLDADPSADAAAPVVERATEVAAPGASPAAASPAAAPVAPEHVPPPPPAGPAASEPDEEEDDVFPPEFAEADDEPSPADPWFLAAWGVAVIAIVVGGAFWWAGLMADNPFSGVNQSDRWLQYVGWVVAPSLIQGGLLGLVAMFVWTGIRWARRHSEHS